ncbi:MAG: peroxiredoxin family protein [Planctomycetota bacterium]
MGGFRRGRPLAEAYCLPVLCPRPPNQDPEHENTPHIPRRWPPPGTGHRPDRERAASYRFGDYRGKVVLFYFWSKSCPWVVHNEHKLTDLDNTYKKNKDVVVLAINANHTEIGRDPQLPVMPNVSKDADEVVQKKAAADAKAITDEARKHYAGLHRHMKRADLHHTILADHGNKVANMFQARTTPHCYVLDKKGVLRYAGALCNDRANPPRWGRGPNLPPGGRRCLARRQTDPERQDTALWLNDQEGSP